VAGEEDGEWRLYWTARTARCPAFSCRCSPAGPGWTSVRTLRTSRLVYEWAEKEQHITRSPALVHQVRLRGGATATVADEAPRDVRSADVKWVTPRT
jgi:hypothetical protein